MARGYLVRLGDGALGAGDAVVGPTIGFHIDQTIGLGSWTWSGTDSNGVAQTDLVDTGTYYLADDGNVYFVPDTVLADDLTSGSVTTSPAFGTPAPAATAGDDTIVEGGADNVLYGGPDASRIGTGSDTLDGGAGQDLVFGGDGDDVVVGGGDADTVYGGAGNDGVYGDSQSTPSTSGQTLQWELLGPDGTDISGGFSQDTGDVTVMVDFNNDGNMTGATVSDDPQFTGFGGFGGPPVTSAAQLSGDNSVNDNDQVLGGEDIPTATVSLVFTANAGTGLANAANDVSFYINGVDSGSDEWVDQITVNAYDVDGNVIPVSILPGFLSDTVSGQTVTAGPGEDTSDSPSGAAQVFIAGPAHYIEIIYTNQGEGPQDIWLTDVDFTSALPTEAGDTLFGDAGEDSLYGGVGDDTLYGGTEDDSLYGGVGDDTLDGGAGNNRSYGGDGADSLTDTSGTNSLYGGAGDDTVTGGSATDSLYGDAGNDTLLGEAGNDTLFGGAGDDDMRGGDGNDRLTASSGNDTLHGDAGDDRIYGQSGEDTLFGGEGRDTVDGGTGNDDLFGGTGNDSLDGDAGNDRLFGEDGNDVLNGADGDDTVFGGAGNDTIVNDPGADELHGDAGNDLFLGLTGNDTAYGGVGSDTFVANASDTGTAIFGGEDLEGGDTDILRTALGSSATVTFSSAESGTYETTGSGQATTFEGIERVETGDEADILNAAGSAGGITAATQGGNDTLTGSDFADNLDAGAGDDTAFGGAGHDSLVGNDGDDDLFGDAGNDTLSGDTGNDTLAGGDGDDTLFGGDGEDTFRVDPADGSDVIFGGENLTDIDTLDLFDSGSIQSANVTLNGTESGTYSFGIDSGTGVFSEIEAIQTGAGNDVIDGDLGTASMQINTGAGDDSVLGTQAGDTIVAGLGADTIQGGTGADHIDLGNGGINDTDVDVLVINDGDGDDLITNFELPTDNGDGTYTSHDLLDVTGTSNFDGTQVDVADVTIFADFNGDAVISFPQGVTLTFAGVTVAQINDPAILAAMGFPVQDQIVEGTEGSDVIDVNYIDDPEGDVVDNSDALDGSNNDLIEALGGNDTAYGGAGDDMVYGGAGDDSVIGEEGDDTLFGDAGSDFLNGVIGNDTLYGGAGDDFLESGSGDDTVFGGGDDDSVNGDTGNDHVYGGAGNDYVRGSFGNDTVYGDEGDDYVWGGYGDDVHVVADDFGNDTFFGDSEAESYGDTLDLSGVTDDLTINLRDGVDEIGSFTDGNYTATYSEIEHIVLGGGTDTLELADNSGSDRVLGFQAPTQNADGSYTPGDLLDVSELTSDFGDTPVTVADVTVTDDGSGNATLSFPGGENLTLVGVSPADLSSPLALAALGIPIVNGIVNGTENADLIDASYVEDIEDDRIDNNDAILPGQSGNDDIVLAGAGNDTVLAGAGNDEVFGEAGDDTLNGGIGDDELYGQDGADTVIGGEGDDTLYGGTGDDAFTVDENSGADVIEGGENAGDLDVISFAASSSAQGVDVTFTGDEAGTYAISGTTTSGSFSQIEQIDGTDHGDTINAALSGVGVTVDARDGDDTITLGAGDDTVFGGTGTDTVVLGDGSGSNWLFGGTGGTPTGDVLDAQTITEDATLSLVNQGDGTLSSASGTQTFDSFEDIILGTGNDSVTGSTSRDTINAGGGNDTLEGAQGDDVLRGGDGDDTFIVGVGDGFDQLHGNDGNDSISFDNGASGQGVTVAYTSLGTGTFTGPGGSNGDFTTVEGIRGSAGDDTIDGSGDTGGLTLDGGAGDDIITGGTASDTITGGAGNDSLNGGEADDTFVLEDGFGVDTISGGLSPGEVNGDTLDASAVTADLTWDLSSSTNEEGTVSDGINSATYARVENRILGDGDDTILLGGEDDDSFEGFEGPIDNGDGSFTAIDMLDVSDITGADTGNTTIADDGNGNAVLTFVNGATLTLIGLDPLSINSAAALSAIGIPLAPDAADGTVSGTSGDDVIDLTYTGDADGDLVDNNDATLAGDSGNDDLIEAGDGNDTIDAGDGADEVYGGAGDDSFVSSAGDDSLYGGTGADSFEVNEGSGTDIIDGGEGVPIDDTLDFSTTGAGLGVTVSFSGNEAGTYDVGSGLATGSFSAIEEIIGTSEDDSFTGSSGVEELYGGAGNDTISASGGDDAILGGAGDDAVDDGAGDDTVFGGTGNDTFVTNSGTDSLFGGEGDDVFELTDGLGDEMIEGGIGSESGDGDVLDASQMTDNVTLNLSAPEAGTLTSTGTTATFSEIETIQLGTGDDTVSGSSGADRVNAGTGHDTINSFGSHDTVFGDAGNDTIDGGGGADTVYGGDGEDSLTGGTGADSVYGGAGDDFIEASQGDSIAGGSGDDFIRLVDLNETATGTIDIDGNGDASEGDTLDVGGLVDLQTVLDAANDNGAGSFSGSVVLNDGTTLSFADIENIICFASGTRIATPQGARAIETLLPGDLVLTRDHGLRPIRWIGQRTVAATGKLAPVRLRPGVMPGLETDLWVSPQHRMLFQGYRAELLFGESEVLVPAKHLIDGKAVTQDDGGHVTYVHMMFDEHEIVFAEGAASESFHPGTVAMDTITDAAREELFEIFPDLRTLPESYGGTARRCLLRHEAHLLRA